LERRSEVVSIATSYSGGDILEFLQQISWLFLVSRIYFGVLQGEPSQLSSTQFSIYHKWHKHLKLISRQQTNILDTKFPYLYRSLRARWSSCFVIQFVARKSVHVYVYFLFLHCIIVKTLWATDPPSRHSFHQ
jgi:hypothetical protein